MKRKMRTTANGPRGVFLANQVYDFEALGCEDLGEQFESAGYAERVWEAAVEPPMRKAVEPPVESVEPVEPEVPEEEEVELEPWPLRRFSPQTYLASHPEGPKAELAKRYVEAGKPNG